MLLSGFMKRPLIIGLAGVALLAAAASLLVIRVPSGSVSIELSGGAEPRLLQPGFHFGKPGSDIVTYDSLTATARGTAGDLDFTVSGTMSPERVLGLHEAMDGRSFDQFLSEQTAELLRQYAAGARPVETLAEEFRASASDEIVRVMIEGGLSEAALSIDPPDGDTFLSAAQRLAPIGDAWELRPVLTRELQTPEGAASWQMNTAMGMVNESERLVVEAETNYLDALAIMPTAIPPMERLMAIYMAVGEWAKLQRVLDAALTQEPTSIPHINWTGLVLLKRGDLTNAERLFNQGLDLDPENPLLLSNAGTLLMKVDRVDEAVPLFEKAVTVAPDNPQALFNYGSVLAATDRFEEALPFLERAEIAGQLTPQLARTLSIVHERLGNEEEASSYRDKALALEGQSLPASGQG